MANIINNNFNNLKIKLNTDEYWDFFICKDTLSTSDIKDVDNDGCLISYIDMSDEECIEGQWIKGKKGYVWENANNTEFTLENIGYTGFDNGLFSFRRDRIMNKDFLKLYQETKFHNHDTTSVLHLHQISGSTLQYDYPISVEDGTMRLNGGFYQGFFETHCDEYAILPSKIEEEWNLDFKIKKSELEPESSKTLNDKYPNNKGIFFFIGTRAENKWIYLYDDSENECDDLGVGDYVDGGEIDTKKYGITNFLDVSIEMPIPYEAVFLDDYLSFKYYGDKIYNPTEITEDKFFIDDYIEINEKPNIIDEKNNNYEDIIWCCGNYPQTVTGRICRCGCGCRGVIKKIEEEINPSLRGYFSGCELFGDDYLLDVDNLDDGTDYIEADIDISDFEYMTADGFELKFSRQYKIRTNNKFLFFNRTCTGFTVNNWRNDDYVEFFGRKSAFKGNLFLLMNRTCTGFNVNTIDCLRNSVKAEYNIYKDLYNNALAFRITDKGEIGYRYFALDCEEETKCKVIEAYSKEGVIQEDEWYDINVKIDRLNSLKMKLYFYVNGNLKFISKELPLLNLRALNDLYEKQGSVPYNISLGGGTQGLAETILPNYMRNPYRVYPLEENFAGSFIGYIKLFKFYQCPMNYSQIKYNFQKQKNN